MKMLVSDNLLFLQFNNPNQIQGIEDRYINCPNPVFNEPFKLDKIFVFVDTKIFFANSTYVVRVF